MYWTSNELLKKSLFKIYINFGSNFKESSTLQITSNFLRMYCWSSASEDESTTLNSIKYLSNKLCSKLSSLWFFFLNLSTDVLKVFMISSMFSRWCLPRVSNCWIVPNNSMSFETLLQNRSNFQRILFGENSNCFPFGMFISFSFVISYWAW